MKLNSGYQQMNVFEGASHSARSWSAPALWRFRRGVQRPGAVTKRRRAAAVQDAGAPAVTKPEFSSVKPHPRCRSAFTLIECLIYIAILGILFSLAITTFWKCYDYSRDLRRNSDDVVRAMQAGERWREDIRAAKQIEIADQDGSQVLRLSLSGGTIQYTFTDAKVWRDDGQHGKQVFLAGVKSSEAIQRKRDHVSGWTWEVELVTRHAAARVRPMFTFTAVQDTEVKP